VIDWPPIGRRRLQIFSFAALTILFMSTAAIFDHASSSTLIALYMLSSFFGQFGANVTTYVMAAETYPTELRATCHGLSAFMGKTGALIATIVFTNKTTKHIFWICGSVSLAGAAISAIFSVDLTRVSLAEHDAQLELFLEGRPQEYKGLLNAPQHLSVWEQVTGFHGEYDPNWAMKVVEADIARSEHTYVYGNTKKSEHTYVDNNTKPEKALNDGSKVITKGVAKQDSAAEEFI